MKAVIQLLSIALLLSAQAPDVTGRWTGTADTVDEAGTKRQEKQTIDIRLENGKLTGNRIDKNGKPGLKLDVRGGGFLRGREVSSLVTRGAQKQR